MVAAAFTQVSIYRGTQNGRVIHIPQTVDDVAGNYAVSPDGNGFIQLPSDQPYALIDVIVVTGGTDTNFQEFFANGTSTGIKMNNKSNLNTAVNRQFQVGPLVFKPGSLIRYKESAT